MKIISHRVSIQTLLFQDGVCLPIKMASKTVIRSITLTANGRNDHVTMFTLYLPLAVFSFSVKLSSFALVSKDRIILHYSHLCFFFFQETLSFAALGVNAILNLSINEKKKKKKERIN